jgi:hypothetical protein
MNRRILILGASLAMSVASFAQPKPAEAPGAEKASLFSLTIYSDADPALFDPQEYAESQVNGNPGNKLPGYGVIRETRKIDLIAGENTIKFTDVASGIDPTTVSFKSLTAPATTAVLEQNYEYDLVSPDKLLAKYVGHNIIINRKQEPLKDDKSHTPETIQGKLLSYDGSTFVLQTDNKQLPVQIVPRGADLSEIKLFDLETGLITKPTLVWKLSAEQPGQHDAQVTYQTNQITWRADYSVVVNKDDTAADIGAWVTVVNQSGAAYPEAKLKLIAGDVRRLRPPEEAYARRPAGGLAIDAAAAKPVFAEKSFFEYHLYTLSRPTSIGNNSTKQIELFPRKLNVPIEKVFVYYGLPADERYNITPNPNQDRQLGQHSNNKVDVYIQAKNTEKNGLGIPLPAGRIRAYKRDDADGLDEFIGEDVIQHTPKDEAVLVRLGIAFDIAAERTQTAFEDHFDEKWISESFEIKLRNHKKTPVQVIVKENLFRWTNWEITKSSDKFEKKDFRTIQFPVEVPPGGEKTVTYTVKYSW